MDAYVLLDMAKLDEERFRLGRNYVQRPQARDREGWKILAVCWYHIKLDSTPLARRQSIRRVRPTACKTRAWGLPCLGAWGACWGNTPQQCEANKPGLSGPQEGGWGCWG